MVRARLLISLLVTVVAFVLAMPRPAAAHPLAPSLLEIEETSVGVVALRWKTPAAGVPGNELVPMLPEHCERPRRVDRSLQGRAVVEEFETRCDASIVRHAISVSGIAGSKANVILKVSLLDGRQFTSVLTAASPNFAVPAEVSPAGVLGEYVRLGFAHILSGLDHMLFLLGLVLLSAGLRSLFLTVTMFTIGHSVTLSLAMLGWVHVPQGPVEVLIALSICFLALELLKKQGPRAGAVLARRSSRYLWLVALLIGLLHGLGFAGALAEIGLPTGDIPLALLSFNLGIEAGQVLLVAVVVVVRALLERVPRPSHRWVPVSSRMIAAYVMGTLSVFWVLERGAGLLSQ